MSKLPSGRFPFISLAKSIERAKAIFENDKNGKGLKVPVAFSAWGYSDKSSGGFQTIAALKGYGLLVDEGANDDRAVKLTSEARQFFQTEIDADKDKLCARFAAKPSLFGHLLEHWDGGTVDDPVARTYLKTAIGLNEQSARSALGIYKENLSFVSPKGSDKIADDSEADDLAAERIEGKPAMQHGQQQQPLAQQTVAVHSYPGVGPELKVTRVESGGYVVHLSGSVMTKAHAAEVVTLLTALQTMLPDGDAEAPGGAVKN